MEKREKLKSQVNLSLMKVTLALNEYEVKEVVALEKDYILDNMGEVFYLVIIGILLFIILYAVAWVYAIRMNGVDR